MFDVSLTRKGDAYRSEGALATSIASLEQKLCRKNTVSPELYGSARGTQKSLKPSNKMISVGFSNR